MAGNNNTPRNNPNGYRKNRQNSESGYRTPIMNNSSLNNASSQYNSPVPQKNMRNYQGGADAINDPMKKSIKID